MQDKVKNIGIEVEDLSAVKKRVSVTVPAELVKKELKAAYKVLRSSTAVAGFRKGSVPVNILKARFGDHVKGDVAKKLVEGSYPHALNEKGLVPVEHPDIEVDADTLSEDSEFSYALTVEVNPEVKIEGYKEMELTSQPIEVTDKEVEEGLEKLRQGRAQFKEVDRAAKKSDLVVVDFEGSMDGKPIKGSKSEDYPLLLGENTLLPGFDEALVGACKGDNKQAIVPFPENYVESKLAGKEGMFEIAVKAVKEKTVPELDDEFAKDVECKDLAELKEKVRAEIVEEKKKQEKERVKTEILDKLIEKHPFEVPDTLVKKYLGLILNRVVDNMKRGVVAPGDSDLSAEELGEKYRDVAVRQVKEDVILDSISAAEKIDITEAEYDAAIVHLAGLRNVTFDKLKSRIEREGALEVIKDGLKHEKVFEIIIGSSKTAA